MAVEIKPKAEPAIAYARSMVAADRNLIQAAQAVTFGKNEMAYVCSSCGGPISLVVSTTDKFIPHFRHSGLDSVSNRKSCAYSSGQFDKQKSTITAINSLESLKKCLTTKSVSSFIAGNQWVEFGVKGLFPRFYKKSAWDNPVIQGLALNRPAFRELIKPTKLSAFNCNAALYAGNVVREVLSRKIHILGPVRYARLELLLSIFSNEEIPDVGLLLWWLALTRVFKPNGDALSKDLTCMLYGRRLAIVEPINRLQPRHVMHVFGVMWAEKFLDLIAEFPFWEAAKDVLSHEYKSVNFNDMSEIYLMRKSDSDSMFKVGKSNNPNKRAKGLSAGHPHRVLYLDSVTCLNWPEDEKTIRRALTLSLKGNAVGASEWFTVPEGTQLELVLKEFASAGFECYDAQIAKVIASSHYA